MDTVIISLHGLQMPVRATKEPKMKAGTYVTVKGRKAVLTIMTISSIICRPKSIHVSMIAASFPINGDFALTQAMFHGIPS